MNNNNSIRPGFNGQSIINLEAYKKLQIKQFDDATWLKYDFLDLSTVDLESEDFVQLGIRDEVSPTGKNDRVEAFMNAFKNKGFDTSYFPPCMDTNGKWLDGRGRVRAAIANQERWIPVAIYSRTNASLLNTVTNGIKANLHPPQSPATHQDFVNAAVHLISEGALANNRANIEDWLYNKANVDQAFDNSVNGQVTRMVDAILKRASSNASLIRKLDVKSAHAWIKKNLKMEKEEYVLINTNPTSVDTYTERAWCRHIAPNLASGDTPVKIIYYTGATSPSEAREGLKNSIDIIEKQYQSVFDIVNQLHSGVFAVAQPPHKPYNVMGAIPQIVKAHNVLKATKLVPVNKY
tara:strand:- start:122 stop:1171 length:1050 start_codon:yes stop_codon:yes gene_type:complete